MASGEDIYEVNDKEEAKHRAAQRMRGAPHETWTLIPGSDATRTSEPPLL